VCNRTFARFYTSAVVDVKAYLASTTTTAFVDAQYNQANAMATFATTSYAWKKMSVQFPASSGYKLFQGDL
jgi:hypothetical protein